MAIDFKQLDKRKLASFAIAIAVGLIAMVLTNSFIEENSIKKAKMIAGGMSSAETQKLLERLEGLERSNQEMAGRQQSLEQFAQMQMAQAQQPTQRPTQQSLAVKTPQGKRAITVTVEKLFAVGGMVSPGDYVDIIAHLTIPRDTTASVPLPTGQDQIVSMTLFQNVLVLAVGNNTQPGVASTSQDNPNAIPVTFALNPQEAALASFVQQHGSLQLVLRPPLETQAYLLPPSSWDSLSDYVEKTQGFDLGVEKKGSPVDPQAPIEIFRGGQK